MPVRTVAAAASGTCLGVVLLLALTRPATGERDDPPRLTVAGAKAPLKPLVTGLTNPTAVAVAFPDKRVFVAVAGELGKDGDGEVLVLKGGEAVPFAKGFDDPTALVAFQQWLYVIDKKRVWRVDAKGKAAVFTAADAFPTPPGALSDADVDEFGNLYVLDAGAVYRVPPKGKVTSVRAGKLKTPAALLLDGASFFHLADSSSGTMSAVRIADGSAAEVADGLGTPAGLTRDYHGRVYVADRKGGRVLVIPRPTMKPVVLAAGFQAPADPCLGPGGKSVLVPDTKAGTVTAVPATVPGAEVDETPLPIESEVAFPKLKWTGWEPTDSKGKLNPLRPIVLTHAGDGSDRVFVATQHGVVHAFPNDQKATATKVFLDIQDRVKYSDSTNEEGFLGLAFHPKYKKNREFFVFYTPKKEKLTNVVSRFKCKEGDPDQADPDSEEVLLRIKKPFWNHDGGTICFGPDGYLYVTHGDGGSANDPFGNGQNLKTLLGKVLRIDVDRKDEGLAYAIPKDNPFVKTEGACPEIWAYGLRNIWRMAFDGKDLWAGDVGQNLYEEINLIVRGGNYGWNRREALHPFGAKGVGPSKDLIDPIWEYHHDVGKSITGGHVYRGKRLPELAGSYLYADYVSGALWALKYDKEKGRVVANRPLKGRGLPVLSFGEDEQRDAYYLIVSATGQGVYRFVRSTDKGAKP